MHLVFVLFGITNAWLLARVLVATQVSERIAYAAAIVFSLTPYVVYVHGWTGTLADLLTLGLGLLASRFLQRAVAATDPIESFASEFASVMVVHVGPGVVGLAWWWEPTPP